MKSIIKVCLLALTFWMVSCDNLSDINIDPNNSPNARPQEVLTSALVYTAYVLDYGLNTEAFLWGQYWTWGTGVSLGDNARYIQEPRDANQSWSRSYRDALADIKFLKTGEASNSAYRGIGMVVEAMIYGYLVDHFGDVPYSEAIKGTIADGSILAPSYDDDAAIYPQLITSLDEAIAELTLASNDQAISVGAEDMIYGGDLGEWIKFANSLKLRLLMRMSDVNDVAQQVRDVVAFGHFIESADDIASVPWSGATGSENPMYARQESGIGNFYKAATTVTNIMDELEDPRKFYFYKEAVNFPGEIRAGDQNQIALCFTCVSEDWSDPADITYSPSASTIYMSDWETWFLRAEAAMKYGTNDDAATAFANAIEANFVYVGGTAAEAATFTAGLGFDGSNSALNRKLLAIQKWISMNGLQEAEGWIEARRFDKPGEAIFSNSTDGVYQTPLQSSLPDHVFPNRWLYPESEATLNSSFPGQASVTDKVFWDL